MEFFVSFWSPWKTGDWEDPTWLPVIKDGYRKIPWSHGGLNGKSPNNLGIPELNHVSLHFITGWWEMHHLISHFIDDFPKHRAFQFATFDCGYLKEHMINNFDSLHEMKPFCTSVVASRSFSLSKYNPINYVIIVHILPHIPPLCHKSLLVKKTTSVGTITISCW